MTAAESVDKYISRLTQERDALHQAVFDLVYVIQIEEKNHPVEFENLKPELRKLELAMANINCTSPRKP